MVMLKNMGFYVTFISLYNKKDDKQHIERLIKLDIEIKTVHPEMSNSLSLEQKFHRGFENLLARTACYFNFVFFCGVDVAFYSMNAVKRYIPDARIIFHTIDLHHLRFLSEAEFFSGKAKEDKIKQANLYLKKESAMIHLSDLTTVVSATELEYLNIEYPNENIKLLTAPRKIRGSLNSFENRKDIIFVGFWDHQPNKDAIFWFVQQVMPILREKIQGVSLHIVGGEMKDDVKGLQADDIKVVGYVEDLETYLDTIRINIAPLRFGSGIKGKVGMAMACGLPSVITNVAAEGMGSDIQESSLIADSTEDFAEKICQLYNDKDLWELLSKRGLDFVKTIWGEDISYEKFADVFKFFKVETEIIEEEKRFEII